MDVLLIGSLMWPLFHVCTCEAGDFDMVIKLCAEVINHQFIVDTALIQRAVDMLVKEAKIEEAEELVELGKSRKHFQYKLKLPLDK
jgi:hypothetical protein